MKKSFIFCAFFSLLVGCASTNVDVSSDGKFKTSYDDIVDATFIVHDDMELGYFYNLKDNISGERENVRLYISNKNLVVEADYQNKKWAFVNSVVFLDGKGGRLEVSDGERSSEIYAANVLRERYVAILDGDKPHILLEILRADKPSVAFVGTKYRTDKLEIKRATRSAMIATIEKWRSIRSE